MRSPFEPVAWIRQTNVYEVNLRQYTSEGSFEAFGRQLPRLRAMGVETLWFMPITPISLEKRLGTLGSYYACSDYTATNPEFGSIDDFRNLVLGAHVLGFKVIIDWVANHTGWDHIWTQTHPEYYKRNAAGEFYDNHGWTDVIDLNYYDQAMRRDMINAMRFWVEECDIDGFRCDMAHLVPLDFWRQARMQLGSLKPLFWLAETDDPMYLQVFDCCYAWQWMHDTEKLYSGESSLMALRDCLKGYATRYPENTSQLFFTSNHDENSWNGTEYEKYGQAAQAFALFSFLWNGIPLVYSGQELPNRKRLRFFEKDVIAWTEPLQLESFYHTLMTLRATHPALTTGTASKPFLLPTNVDQYVLAILRSLGNREVLAIINFSPNHLFVQLPEGFVHGSFTDAFSGEVMDLVPGQSFELNPWAYRVLKK